MNTYETVVILVPILSDEQKQETINKFKNILSSEKAEIINEENWGLLKLAYPIQNKMNGIYFFIEFKANPTIVSKLETQFRRDEKIIRFLTFRQNKAFAEYATKRRNQFFELKKDI